jgi:hypothetical protein
MKFFIVSLGLTLSTIAVAWGQTALQVTIQDAATDQPLIGATALLNPGRIGAAADTSGRLVLAVPTAGRFALTCSFVGYQTRTDSLMLPGLDSLTVQLTPEGRNWKKWSSHLPAATGALTTFPPGSKSLLVKNWKKRPTCGPAISGCSSMKVRYPGTTNLPRVG